VLRLLLMGLSALPVVGAAGEPIASFSFEGLDARAGWALEASPLQFTGSVADAARTGEHSLHLQDHVGITWGFWACYLPLTEPGAWRVRAWVRMRGGEAVMWVQARDATRAVLPGAEDRAYLRSYTYPDLVPGFIPAEYLKGVNDDGWHPLELTVRVPEGIAELYVRLGSYFAPSTLWFDDVTIERVEEGEAQ